jgi:hypothetical protein
VGYVRALAKRYQQFASIKDLNLNMVCRKINTLYQKLTHGDRLAQSSNPQVLFGPSKWMDVSRGGGCVTQGPEIEDRSKVPPLVKRGGDFHEVGFCVRALRGDSWMREKRNGATFCIG